MRYRRRTLRFTQEGLTRHALALAEAFPPQKEKLEQLLKNDQWQVFGVQTLDSIHVILVSKESDHNRNLQKAATIYPDGFLHWSPTQDHRAHWNWDTARKRLADWRATGVKY